MMLNDYQLKQLLAYLGTAFPGELSDAEAKVWIETFEESAAPFATAYDALKKLKRVKMFRPTHADFFEAVERLNYLRNEQRAEIESGKTGGDVCVCGGGWIEVDRIGQGHVERCERCNATPRSTAADGSPVEHPKGCSCSRCFYGPKRLAAIQAGRDGMGPRRDPQLKLAEDEPQF